MSAIEIPRETKSELIKVLEKEEMLFVNEDGVFFILEILNDIWDLENMPSTDPRYDNAYSDIDKHMVLNDDWSYHHLFTEILHVYQEDGKFSALLEGLVSRKYRSNTDYIKLLVLIINPYLRKHDLTLAVQSYDNEGNEVYKIQNLSATKTIELPTNKIPFFVTKIPLAREYSYSSHYTPQIFPSFVLVHNDGWNDYGYYTTYHLFYYQDAESRQKIGYVKITDGESVYTNETLPEKFNVLPETYISLGQDFEYYESLKNALGNLFESVLFALNDCAFFHDIFERFEKNGIFNTSLIRDNRVEKNRREVKYKIYGYDLNNLYNFKYKFTPKYAADQIEIAFEFNRSRELTNRIYAIIGKNGTGKTQLISSLPLDISRKNDEVFEPRTPLFSKVIAVSYSIFDNFQIPENTISFSYIYCGLQKIINGNKELLSIDEQILRFNTTCKSITEKLRDEQLYAILTNFIEEEILNEFIIFNEGTKILDFEKFLKIKDRLSSGQNILLFTITEIVANIRFDSLILFDEPETHLHPNAISQLMNLIHELVVSFDSFCIIATHSPLIIQELLSNHVFIIERKSNFPSIRKIGMESFAENLTNITEEIFGNKTVNRQFERIINELIGRGKNYEQIVELLQSDNIPLSLNARLFIKSRLSYEEFELF